MKEFRRILFPVDLSETSSKLVPYVQAMATKFDAKIYLIFVARVFDYFTNVYVPHPSISQFEKEIIDGAEKRLYEFRDEQFKDYAETKTAVVAGEAWEEIINYAQDKGIDLIIMGTHGRKGLDKVIFGSVAERVIKTSPVPVLVINPFKVD
jgi:nucleotide-binding universal stress UspA family protein